MVDESLGSTQKPRQWLRAFFTTKRDASVKDAIEEAIEEVLEEHEEQEGNQLAPEEETILRNALSFGDITVRDIMVPRTDIVAISDDLTLEELQNHIIEQGHTRIPVYSGTLDKVEGFLHVKDLFPVIAGKQPFDLKKLIRPVQFVAPSMKIIDLLVRLRRQASHMAMVLDEFGGTDGLVTLEDLFEEIVGDIQDEHDEEDAPRELAETAPGMYEADGRVRIDRLERLLGLNLSLPDGEDAYDTLAGLLMFELGRLPVRGEVIRHESGARFEVLEADHRRVKRVRLSDTGVPVPGGHASGVTEE